MQHVKEIDKNIQRKQVIKYKKVMDTTCKANGHKRLNKQAIHYKPKLAKSWTGHGHKKTNKTSIKCESNWQKHVQMKGEMQTIKKHKQYKTKAFTTCREFA